MYPSPHMIWNLNRHPSDHKNQSSQELVNSIQLGALWPKAKSPPTTLTKTTRMMSNNSHWLNKCQTHFWRGKSGKSSKLGDWCVATVFSLTALNLNSTHAKQLVLRVIREEVSQVMQTLFTRMTFTYNVSLFRVVYLPHPCCLDFQLCVWYSELFQTCMRKVNRINML